MPWEPSIKGACRGHRTAGHTGHRAPAEGMNAQCVTTWATRAVCRLCRAWPRESRWAPVCNHWGPLVSMSTGTSLPGHSRAASWACVWGRLYQMSHTYIDSSPRPMMDSAGRVPVVTLL